MNRLKKLREDMNLKQSDVAKILNISSVAYSYYENEKRDIPTETLAILANYFNCSIDYLLCKSDIRNNGTLKLTADEIYFIKHVKKLDENQKQIIKNTMEAFLDNKEN